MTIRACVPVLLVAFGLVTAPSLMTATSRAADQRGRGGIRPPSRPGLRADQPRPIRGALAVGDLAPDFTLAPRDGGAPVSLSSFRGRSPVALVFGSYT